MMMGAGILPGPFTRADEAGSDTVLEQLESAQSEWGDAFEPPPVLKRLVAQNRLGKKTGQGFFPYPQPDRATSRRPSPGDPRGHRDRVAEPAAGEPALAEAIRDLIDLWESVEARRGRS